MRRTLKQILHSFFHNSRLPHQRVFHTMAGLKEMMEQRLRLALLPYTQCNTCIVSLADVDIPEHASEDEYRDIYRQYTQQVSPSNRGSNASLLRDAIESLRHGIAPPVGFPTETVYGLGADATNEAAVSGIFAAKGRPSDNPLIVHVASVEHLERLTGASLPDVYRPLVEKYWPGPLTILLPVPENNIFAQNVHPAQNTIGFRVPSSKFARFFIAATDRPIAGPSANSSGKPSPTTAQHVLDDLKGKINFVLDGGACDVGVESTVVDGLHDPPLILRPGGVGLEEFRVIGRRVGGKVGDSWARTAIGYKHHSSHDQPGPQANNVVNGMTKLPVNGDTTQDHHSASEAYFEDANGAPRAPGMKYRHYAPTGRLVLFSDGAYKAGQVERKLWDISYAIQSSNAEKHVKVGIMSRHWPPFAGLHVSPSEGDKLGNKILSVSRYRNLTTMTTTLCLNDTDFTVYNVHLGPDLQTLAQSLFGVLRLFDDLGCEYIFAAEVRRTGSDALAATNGYEGGTDKSISGGKARHDLEDAVIDRISKAAAEHIM
jgi:L-threonylcarbamoyladenylate synthase